MTSRQTLTFAYCLFQLMLVALVAASAGAQEPKQLPEMTVVGSGEEQGRYAIDPALTDDNAPDVARLAKRMPGGNVNNNGPLAGQITDKPH